MVTSLGRTGTTWLMRLLSEHPELVTRRALSVRSPAAAVLDALAPGHRLSPPTTESRHPRPASRLSNGQSERTRSSRRSSRRKIPRSRSSSRGEHVLDLAGFAHQAAESVLPLVHGSIRSPEREILRREAPSRHDPAAPLGALSGREGDLPRAGSARHARLDARVQREARDPTASGATGSRPTPISCASSLGASRSSWRTGERGASRRISCGTKTS